MHLHTPFVWCWDGTQGFVSARQILSATEIHLHTSIFFSFYEAGFFCVAVADLKLALCFLGAGIKDMGHHYLAFFSFK